ncbi:MAG: hypothetical protein ACD_75C02624G0004 [uncultured bacterium]|nr:MAG: hypothetical protein ACD_75C02624G0004 [uncultured bacterium]
MEKNDSRKNMSEVVFDLESSYGIAMAQTQALLEVLRTYFENSLSLVKGRVIDIPDSTMVYFLYQVDENLERMDGIVAGIIKESNKAPVRLRAVA